MPCYFTQLLPNHWGFCILFESINNMHLFKSLVINSIHFRHSLGNPKIAVQLWLPFKETRAAKNVLSFLDFLTKKIVLFGIS